MGVTRSTTTRVHTAIGATHHTYKSSTEPAPVPVPHFIVQTANMDCRDFGGRHSPLALSTLGMQNKET